MNLSDPAIQDTIKILSSPPVYHCDDERVAGDSYDIGHFPPLFMCALNMENTNFSTLEGRCFKKLTF